MPPVADSSSPRHCRLYSRRQSPQADGAAFGAGRVISRVTRGGAALERICTVLSAVQGWDRVGHDRDGMG